MEYVIKELLHPEEDDEANFIYSELDSQRRETRRVEFYPSGMCFAYGGDMGQDEVLDPAPFPDVLLTFLPLCRGIYFSWEKGLLQNAVFSPSGKDTH